MTHFPIAKIQRAEYNPRVMPDSEMDALMKSLRTFGFVEPVVLNKRPNIFHDKDILEPEFFYVLVGGHQRTTATERLIAAGTPPSGVVEGKDGWEIPAVLVELDDAHERALNLALNKIHGKWDEAKLADIIVGLKDNDIMPATGFREDEVSRILDNAFPGDDSSSDATDGD